MEPQKQRNKNNNKRLNECVSIFENGLLCYDEATKFIQEQKSWEVIIQEIRKLSKKKISSQIPYSNSFTGKSFKI